MPHSHVDAFITSFEKLLPDERKAAMAELRAFFGGYEASCQEWEREMFGAAEGEPSVLGEVSGATLVELMNELRCRPGQRSKVRA